MSFLQIGLRTLFPPLFRDAPKPSIQAQTVRTKFVNRMQMKDQKRRVCVKNYGGERMLLNTVYRCKFLPNEIRNLAHEAVVALPRDSNYIRLRARCYATSRPRGAVHDFRVSRIVFRHLADYNKLSSIQRGMW